MRWAALLLVFFALPAAGQTCPPVPDHGAQEAELHARLQAAPNAGAARVHTAALWDLWLDAPDEKAQQLLDDGLQRRRMRDFAGAEKAFSALVEYCPDYAEGHNQLAILAFMQGDYAAALEGVNAALDRNPEHIGALSGKALALIGLGRRDAAQAVLRKAVELNPWLPERALLEEEQGEPI